MSAVMDWQDINLLLVGSPSAIAASDVSTLFDGLDAAGSGGRLFVRETASAEQATEAVRDEVFDAAIIHIRNEDDLALLEALNDLAPQMAMVVQVTAESSIPPSRLLRAGADEILTESALSQKEFIFRLENAIERKRFVSAAEAQVPVIELLSKGYPLPTILSELLLELERRHPEMLCSILLLDDQYRRLMHGAAPSLPQEYNEMVHGLEIGPKRGSCGTSAWLGKRVIVADIESDPLWADYRHIALQFGLRACWSQPIFAPNGRVIGTFAVYCRQPREPKLSELRLIEKSAGIAGLAITQRETEIALRYRFDFERLILSISTRFIGTSGGDIDGEVDRALREIGEFSRADRSFIFMVANDSKSAVNSHEWCRTGIRSERSRCNLFAVESFPWFRNKLERREVLYVKRLEDLPPEAEAERIELRRRGVHSLIATPVMQGSRLLGILGLETTVSAKVWSSDAVVLLKMCAQIFGNALERKRVEQELLTSRELYRQNEAQLRLTFESAQIGMATCTLHGRLLSVNNSLCKMMGRNASELLGLSFQDLCDPEDRAIPRRLLRDLLRGYAGQIELERRYIHCSGSPIHTIQRLGVVFDAQRRPLYLVVEIEDITERKKWEAESLKASKLESLGVLAGGIAHDFNNILMAVLGAISCSKLESAPDSMVSRRLMDIENAVYRAKDLTHQLLTFSKGGAPIKRIASMAEIVRDTIGFSLAGADVSWSFDTPSNLWPVQVDEGQMSQVINNLILNACQAMPEGGSLSVRCENVVFDRRTPRQYGSLLPRGRYVKLVFVDHGCGIPAEHLPKIFDPFFTTKDGGSGLGLATTYSIVKRHQGHIQVESNVGQGTTFTIFLPAFPGDRPTQKKKDSDQMLRPGHGRILVMDDEVMVRKAAEGMLQRLGYEVDSASNGNEAVELYQRARQLGKPFDAVIMDLTVPGGMGGKHAIRKLKKLDPTVRAIVSSGYADGPVMAEYEKYGFCGVMAKPYEIGTLSNVLYNILEPEKELPVV